MDQWMAALTERRQELARLSRVANRQAMMVDHEERQEWMSAFVEGKTRGLVNRLLSEKGGVHTVAYHFSKQLSAWIMSFGVCSFHNQHTIVR